MNELATVLKWIGIGIMSLFWLYVGARMVTRGVMRSIEEWRKRNG